MKKLIIGIAIAFSVIFICLGFTVKYANDKVYNFLHPREKITIEENNPRTVTLKKGSYFIYGTYNDEQVLWECVSDTTAQCNDIIEFKQYDSKDSDWETSDLRQWLNSDDGFYGNANLNGGKIINGEIYVLSKKEAKAAGLKPKQPTLAAIRNSDSKYFFLNKCCWYWTSSSISTNSQSVAAVSHKKGVYKTLPTDNLTGVCPAFKLKTVTVNVLGGDGTKQKPYVIGE